MPRPKVSLTTCTEALGNESDHGGHGSAALEVISSLPELELRRMLEEVSLSEKKEPRRGPPPPPAMPWRGMQLVPEKQGGRLVLKEVATKNPFALRASRDDGQLRLKRVPPSDGLDDDEVGSNGRNEFEGDEIESGGNGDKTNVEVDR